MPPRIRCAFLPLAEEARWLIYSIFQFILSNFFDLEVWELEDLNYILLKTSVFSDDTLSRKTKPSKWSISC